MVYGVYISCILFLFASLAFVFGVIVSSWSLGTGAGGVWFLFPWISSYYSQELEGVIVITPCRISSRPWPI